MPKSTRDGYKRHFDSASQHITRAMEHLFKLQKAGFSDHPDFSGKMADATQATMVAFNLFAEMRKMV